MHFTDMDALIAAVHACLPDVGSVLVKGARRMQMEQVVQSIEGQNMDNNTCC